MSIPPRSRGEARVRASRSFTSREVILPAQLFIHNEVIGGALLCLAAITALVWANSLWAESYFSFFHETIAIQIWDWHISHTLKHWINDGAMVLFFFVVGLEVKREFVNGELSDPRQAILPGVAALGGMVVPALIYVGFTFHTSGEDLRGWGIPMATDIAFALAVLALLGKRIPVEARIFLLTLATIDDIGAILVIAVFYTEQISWIMIGTAILLFAFMGLLQKLGVRTILLFILAGCLFWLAVLKSGIHATIAGVALGLLTPARPWFSEQNFDAAATKLLNNYRGAVKNGDTNGARALLGQFEELTLGTESLAERLERLIHPWVSFTVLPLFALANAGITLSGEIVGQAMMSPVTWGVSIGLVVGKVSGVLGCSWLATRWGLATIPASLNWTTIAGIGLLSGIGFTVSLFIAGLAYPEGPLAEQAKIGILLASIFSGFGGYMFLRLCSSRKS